MKTISKWIILSAIQATVFCSTQKAYSEGGYEPWASQFDPAAEKIFTEHTAKMAMSLY
jgi:hypothetical protein